jgi:hypothetical protein
MKELRESLVLTDARATSLSRDFLKEGGSTFVLHVEGPLTPELADTLRCRQQVYDQNDSPWRSLKALSLDHAVSACEMSVLRMKLRPTVVTGFTIKPNDSALADGLALRLHFRLKFAEGGTELNSLADRLEKTNEFDLALVALQQSLFDVVDGEFDDVPETDEGRDESEAEPKPPRRRGRPPRTAG